MPSQRQEDTRGHRVRFVESTTEQSDSVQDWVSDVDLAISGLPHPAALTGKSFESEFEELMTKYEVLKKMLDDIEDKMAVLFHQRQRDIETSSSLSSSSSSSKGKTSEELQRAGLRASEGNVKRNPSTEYSAYNSYHGDHESRNKTKTRKARKPKTVEEQNIHINKVLFRESMSR
jgi:glutamate synthase domain-containing protein 2